mgnify:FL=1
MGWYDAKGNLVGTEPTFVPTKNPDEAWLDGTVYYARFLYKQYIIVFESNEADSGKLNDQKAPFDQVVNLTPNAGRVVRDGFKFMGWTKKQLSAFDTVDDMNAALAAQNLHLYLDQEEVINLVDGDNIMVTLWAVWVNVGFNVHYNLDGQNDFFGEKFFGWVDDVDNDRVYKTNTVVTTLTKEDTHGAHRNGYNFTGWRYQNHLGQWVGVGFGQTFVMPNYHVTLTPVWEPITYTVRFEAGVTNYEVLGQYASDVHLKYSDEGKPYFEMEVSFEDLFDANNRFFRSGFDFLGWSVTGTHSWGDTVNNLDGEYEEGWYEGLSNLDGSEVTFTAIWSPRRVTAIFKSYDSVTGGTITGQTTQVLYTGDKTKYDEVIKTPRYRKALAYWTADIVIVNEDGTTATKSQRIEPEDMADYILEGNTTFTAFWVDAREVWYFEGEYGDFYEDSGHDAGHTGGEEGTTRFTHAVPNKPIPTYNGMQNGLPRSVTVFDGNKQITYTFMGWALAEMEDGSPKKDLDGHVVYRTTANGTPMYLRDSEGNLVLTADLSGLSLTEDLFLVATWKQGDCLIIFNRNDPPQPNVPELDGIDLVTGTMPQQLMAYDTQVNLAPNQYLSLIHI